MLNTDSCIKTNNVRKRRHILNLTQRQLAEAVGTSQQQIQRIEAGQYVKLELAIRLCAALQSPLEEIFPSTKNAVKKLSKKGPAKLGEPDPDIDKAMDEAGIDTDPLDWTIRFRLKNGVEGLWHLSSKDKDRLVSDSQEPDKMFFCGTSYNKEIAVNLRQLSFFQPLFDFGRVETSIDDKENGSVCVYLADSTKPLTFSVEPDEEFKAKGEEDIDLGEFRNLLWTLDEIDEHLQADPVITFVDADGEHAFFRTEHVALIEIPLYVTHPEMEDYDDPKSP